MIAYLLRRVGYLLPVILGTSVVVFLIAHFIPGDPVMVMVGLAGGSPESLAQMRARYGLDQPAHIQYLLWLKQLLSGSMGYSIITGRPVLNEILARLPVTLEILAVTITACTIVGVGLGLYAAYRPGSIAETILRLVTVIGMSTPGFVLGVLLIILVSTYFSSYLRFGFVDFVTDWRQNILSIALPVIALTAPTAAVVSRMARASFLEVLQEDYIRTARAKGLATRQILLRHVLKNGFIPILTAIGLEMGYLFGNAVVVEEVFAIPGVARAVFTSIRQRDYPMLQGLVLFISLAYVVINVLVDLGYVRLDPRIRY